MGSSPRPIVLKLSDSPVDAPQRTSDSRLRLPPPPSSFDLRSSTSTRVTPLLHRFGPSGPWPWTSFSGVRTPRENADDIPSRKTTRGIRPSTTADTDQSSDHEWRYYPASHFPNWTDGILRRSGLLEILEKDDVSQTNVRTIDLLASGHFRTGPTFSGMQLQELWQFLLEDPSPEIRVTCYFVEDLSGPIMQMLGVTYDCEPFYFAAAQNDIATRYQEDIVLGKQDHITITLPFLRAIDSSIYNQSADLKDEEELEELIDVQTPLSLVSPDGPDQTLLVDLLALHMVRAGDESTLIVTLPQAKYWLTTSAAEMQERVLLAGKGVYWSGILQQTKDPTFMIVIMLWHALYAWDEAMAVLYEHICYLERRVMIKFNASDIWLTRELHIIRAMLLHYETLLTEFHKTARFVLAHPNPALEALVSDPEDRKRSEALMKKECDNILSEIERLQNQKEMQEQRVKNVLDLVFSTLSVKETEQSLSQGWVMQQLTYVTMAFLPATFVATVFGMNLTEFVGPTNLNWKHFVEATIPLSVGTVWLMIALQHKMHEPSTSIFFHLLWPFMRTIEWLLSKRKRGLLRSATTVVVDPTLLERMEFDEESVQEDGKDTSRARVTRYWGWRPARSDTGSAASTRAPSRATFHSRPASPHSVRSLPTNAAPGLQQFMDAYDQQNEKPWGNARLRRLFGRSGRTQVQRANTLSALQS
ncbi:hypothetical protein EXIGLDRAFT_842848 [Exidia glandulosa HHB12029]|uniref:Cora-domain-containing protein n=1 Tax=Exidia glandulosa HHB12029 TaxID=1314781 RepID=A0A165D0A3_EXIGL|nr:hypothetical protein EXIGLDRAFT_842848 [Exidia glandulosa HHB12029]